MNQTLSPEASQHPPRRFVNLQGSLILLAICLFAFFFRLGSVPLFDLDEGLYVACARQMALTGDFVTPRLNSRPINHLEVSRVPFFEKPIMIYWASAGSMRLFGMTETAARLPAAFAALFLTAIVATAGARWFGQRAGFLAGMVYATAPVTFIDARQMTTDGVMVLWLTLTFLCFWRVYRHAGSPRESLVPALGFWFFAGLSVLTKGVIGLLLPGMVITIFLLTDRFNFRRPWRRTGYVWPVRFRLNKPSHWLPVIKALRPAIGILLFLAIITPWHALIAQTGERDAMGRTFVQEYLIRQHVGRFRGGDKVHNAPILTYVGYFLVGFFPWSCFTPAAFRLLTERDTVTDPDALDPDDFEPEKGEEADRHRFLLVWFWTVFIFFSISSAKLPTYIVPVFPAAAWMVGRWLHRALDAGRTSPALPSLRRGTFISAVTSLILVVVVLAAPEYVRKYYPASPIPLSISRLALHLTGLLFLGCVFSFLAFVRSAASRSWRAIGIGALCLTILSMVGIGVTEGYELINREVIGPYQRLAKRADQYLDNGTQVLFYGIDPRRPSMLFYANYSPIERKEIPMLPLLEQVDHGALRRLIVITSRKMLDRPVTSGISLKQEVADRPAWKLEELSSEGDTSLGWVMLRLTRK